MRKKENLELAVSFFSMYVTFLLLRSQNDRDILVYERTMFQSKLFSKVKLLVVHDFHYSNFCHTILIYCAQKL